MSESNPHSLKYSNGIRLIARDRAAKKVLFGGLGGMGVGVMWFDEVRYFPADGPWGRAGEVDERGGRYAEQYENWETIENRTFPETKPSDWGM